MEKQRKVKIISLVALIVAVLGLTVAFAALSETLTINGTASLDAATWDVHFENISSPTITGDASEVSPPEITDNGITLSKINVNLTKPKDSVKYTVDVVNDGTINAEIVNIVKGQLTEEQERAIEFSVTNEDGTNLEQGFILNAKEKQKLVVSIRYKDDIEASDLLSEQTINLSLTLNYVQTDLSQGSSSSGGGSSGNYGEETISWDLSDTVKMTYYNGELQEDGTYDNGTLVISGTGEIPGTNEDTMELPVHFKLADVSSFDELQWDEEYHVILKYNPIDIIVEEGISNIGRDVFVGLSLDTLELPSTVNEISNEFVGSSIISSLNMKGVETIGDSVFEQCGITSIDMPKVKEISQRAFTGCTLKNVNMPNVEIIERNAFSGNLFNSIRIPKSVQYIGDNAFNGNPLKEIYISNQISIGFAAFGNAKEINGTISADSVIYVPDEETKNSLVSVETDTSNGVYSSAYTTIVVDPTKFE